MASNALLLYLIIALSLNGGYSAPSKLSRAQDVDNIGADLFRPGVCRANLGSKKFLSNDICGVNCMFDVDCPAPQKCCPNSCGGTLCARPFVEDPCSSVTCTGQGQTCQVDENGEGVCVCNTECPEVYQPICDSNGKHYHNRCKMDLRACKKSRTIADAECSGESTETMITAFENLTQSDLFENNDTQFTTDSINTTTGEMELQTTKHVTEETAEEATGIQLSIPEFQVLHVLEGEELKLFCDAISLLETPIYIWLYHRSGEPRMLRSGNQNDGLSVSDDGHYLTIPAVNYESDLGIYTCMLKTPTSLTTARFEVKMTIAETTTARATTTPTKPTADNKRLPVKPSDDDKAPVNADVCSLPMDRGNCLRRDTFPNWYYDLTSQQCRPFTYSGCGGNENRFITYAECSGVCPELATDPCRHPIVTGRCRAHMVRWAYDETTRECVQFVYGGCGKNGNNFETVEECAGTCIDAEEKKEDCLCVEPPLVDSFCASHFVITGYVKQRLLSPGFGALLAVEVEEIIVEGNLTTSKNAYLNGPLAVIRDVAQDACQCHYAKADGKLYIIMGYINEEGYAQVDDSCYVKSVSKKRLDRLHQLRERADRRCS